MSKILAMVLMLGTLCIAGLPGSAVAADDFTVQVVVADPGDRERASAYWLALNSVLQKNMPAGVIDESQRKEVLREPSRYVQSFRYRAFDATADSRLLATRQVREGKAPDSVIMVTFPATLLGIIQREFQALVVEETVITPQSGTVLALIAVEQNGDQFLIGGNRAKKFQSRMIQLGAVNNITFEFPLLDEEDTAIVSPANVLFYDEAVMSAMVDRYQTSGHMSGALVRLSEQSWQSDWQFNITGFEGRSLSLTTRSLDEALLTAVSEISGNSGGAGTGYLASTATFERSGVAIRVENINSLPQHQQVLQLLKKVDDAVIVEGLEPGVTIYRAPNIEPYNVQQLLARQAALTALPSSQIGESTVTYRFR